MPDQSASSRRLKTTNTLLAIVILVLLGHAAWQAMQMSALRAELEQSHRALDDFLARSRVFETDPGNHFRQGPMCTQLTATGRVSIRPGMLTIMSDGERSETPIPNDGALHAALIAHFDIDLSRFVSAGEAAR